MSPLDLLYKELTMSSLISRSNLLDDFFKDFAPGFFVKPLQSEALPSPGQIRMDIKDVRRSLHDRG